LKFRFNDVWVLTKINPTSTTNLLHITTTSLRAFVAGEPSSQQSCGWLGLKVSAIKVSSDGHLCQPVASFHSAKNIQTHKDYFKSVSQKNSTPGHRL